MRNLFAEKFISDFIALGGFQSKHYHALHVTHCSGLQGVSGTVDTVSAETNLRSTAQMQQLIKIQIFNIIPKSRSVTGLTYFKQPKEET